MAMTSISGNTVSDLVDNRWDISISHDFKIIFVIIVFQFHGI